MVLFRDRDMCSTCLCKHPTIRISHYLTEQYNHIKKDKKKHGRVCTTAYGKIWHSFQAHIRWPVLEIGDRKVRFEDIFEYPGHHQFTSLTILFSDDDFQYVKEHGWSLKEKQMFYGHERHEPYEIRKGLLLAKY
jgi:hypothetical protein